MKIKTPKVFLMFVILVSIFNIQVFARGKNCEVHFIDTGQSDCILIKLHDKNYLIDTGWEYYGGKILNYLNSNNVEKIDGIILTHYHDDHYGGLNMLLKSSKVKKVFLPRHNGGDKQKVMNIINKYKVDYEWVEKGWKLKESGLNLRAIAPINIDNENENNNSIVLKGEIDGVRYLFLGDCERKEEEDIIETGILEQCDVLKVSHHGFNTGNNNKLLKIAKPKIAIITCDGVYSPHNAVIDRLQRKKIKSFTTSEEGNLIIKHGKIMWKTYFYYFYKYKEFLPFR